ncbi:hypothetical protein CDD80_4511 [Ophiocordyceps camponoti-rufipedis]|uniref:Ankyrin 2,3/unc44 n=1 Tax=Ophiocordyceps camponoti-rufipedis TaxID=2004952 RepID=A0A2C5XHE1_9HYPO|nr:hypothetical protein CDD80_4511 [Ophiocordyceps camponoti-rufipedis]
MTTESDSIKYETVSARDLVDLDFEQLQRLYLNHRDLKGEFRLDVDGYDELPRVEGIILRATLTVARATIREACRVPNLNEVNARLLKSSSVRERPLRFLPSSCKITPTPHSIPLHHVGDRQLAREEDVETWAHDEIVKDGGRPIYPIKQLLHVICRPDCYRELTWPFDADEPGLGKWEVYQKQMKRWKHFLNWQKDNRDLDDGDDGFALAWETFKHKPELELDGWHIVTPKTFCQRAVEERRRRRQWQREPGCHGFSDYAEAVKRRLQRHGFHQPFQLKEDPDQQDQLTTWIEYLCFECWWLDRQTDSLDRFTKAWQELVDAKAVTRLRWFGPELEVGTLQQRQDEVAAATAAVERAEAHANHVSNEDGAEISSEKRARMMQQAADRLTEARNKKETLCAKMKIFTDFLSSTYGSLSMPQEEHNKYRQQDRVEWVRGQIKVIQEEDMAQRNKGKRQASLEEQPGPKKRQASVGVRRSARIANRQAEAPVSKGPKKRQTSVGVRRSARVAATQARAPVSTTARKTCFEKAVLTVKSRDGRRRLVSISDV